MNSVVLFIEASWQRVLGANLSWPAGEHDRPGLDDPVVKRWAGKPVLPGPPAPAEPQRWSTEHAQERRQALATAAARHLQASPVATPCRPTLVGQLRLRAAVAAIAAVHDETAARKRHLLQRCDDSGEPERLNLAPQQAAAAAAPGLEQHERLSPALQPREGADNEAGELWLDQLHQEAVGGVDRATDARLEANVRIDSAASEQGWLKS